MARVQKCKQCKSEKGKPHKFSCSVSKYPSQYTDDSYVYVTTYVDSSSCDTSSSSSYDSGSSSCDSGGW